MCLGRLTQNPTTMFSSRIMFQVIPLNIMRYLMHIKHLVYMFQLLKCVFCQILSSFSNFNLYVKIINNYSNHLQLIQVAKKNFFFHVSCFFSLLGNSCNNPRYLINVIFTSSTCLIVVCNTRNVNYNFHIHDIK